MYFNKSFDSDFTLKLIIAVSPTNTKPIVYIVEFEKFNYSSTPEII